MRGPRQGMSPRERTPSRLAAPAPRPSAHARRPAALHRVHLCQTSPASQGIRCVGPQRARRTASLQIAAARCAAAVRHAPLHRCRRTSAALLTRPRARTRARPRREFLVGNFAELKKGNPDTPILVREAAGAEAKLIARYGEHSAAEHRPIAYASSWDAALRSARRPGACGCSGNAHRALQSATASTTAEAPVVCFVLDLPSGGVYLSLQQAGRSFDNRCRRWH